MFEHHASHVIMALNHKCRNAARQGLREDAVRLAELAGALEDEFPEAKGELDRRYPCDIKEGQGD